MIDCISLLKQLCVALKTSAFSIVCPKYPQKAFRCRAWSTFWHTAHLTPSHMSFGIDMHLLLRIRLTLPVHFINRSHWLRTCRTAQRHWLFRRWAVYKPCTFSLQQNLVKVYIWCNSTKTVNTRFLALTFSSFHAVQQTEMSKDVYMCNWCCPMCRRKERIREGAAMYN